MIIPLFYMDRQQLNISFEQVKKDMFQKLCRQ